MKTTEQPFFGPKLNPDLEKQLILRELDPLETALINRDRPSAHGGEVMVLQPHEVAVIQWLRRELVRASSELEVYNVGVLLVGEKGHTSVVNEQFDYIGAGLVSISDGVQIAEGDYNPAGMYPGENYSRSWVITATGLADRCKDDTDTVRTWSADRSELLGDREAGTLEDAMLWFANFPGHKVTLVGAYYSARVETADPAVAEEFFAKHGEYADEHEEIAGALTDTLAESIGALAAAAEKLGYKPDELLSSVVQALGDATRDPKRAPAAAALFTGFELQIPPRASAPEATVPPITETAADGTRQPFHP